MKLKFALAAALIVLGGVSQASATIVRETFTGAISGGDGAIGNPAYDRLGLFGPVDANLLGDAYTATYVFNSALGALTSSACSPASAGCPTGENTLSGPPVTLPLVSESLIINGKSFSFGGVTFPVNYAQMVGINGGPADPSDVFAEVEANSDLNSLRDDLRLTNGGLPSSLVAPFSYTVHAGDGADFTDSFFQADTSKGLDRFEFSIAAVTLASGVPEPSTWAMILVGFACLGIARYRKEKSAQRSRSSA
jgi:hypothetical protein